MQRVIEKALDKVSSAPFDETEIAEVLLAEAIVYGNDLTSALQEACLHGHYNVAELFLKSVVIPTAYITASLEQAAYSGYIDVIELLVSHGAEPLNIQGMTLEQASIQGHVDVVKWLMKYGLNIVENGHIAMEEAVSSGRLEVVKVLIAGGINPLSGDCELLIEACRKNGNIGVIELLLEYMNKLPVLSPDVMNNIGAAFDTLYNANIVKIEAIRLLLEYLNKRAITIPPRILNDGLMAGVTKQSLDVVQLFLQYGADPNENKGAVIAKARSRGNVNIIRAIADAARPRGKR